MPNRPNLPARLRRGPPLLLDGATGTELEARGVRSELPLWSSHALLEAPDVLAAIHRDYARAGAEALTAASFRTQRRTLERAGLASRAAELSAQAVTLARRAGGDVYVLGSAPPLEDCYRPDLVPDDESLRREHAEHAGNLAAAGADAILAETHNTAREARAAVAAAAAVGLPVIVSFVCGADARLLSGEPLAEALDAVVPLAPLAVGVNCLPPSAVGACLEILAATGVPFGVYANLGAPGAEPAAPRSAACSPHDYAAHAQAWARAGARFVGGCCGTTPAHLSAVAAQRSA
ncbi:MAG: homocysteine S-methyltransferase family protein [Deltaproteobacteria bacterium]|nr:homocysteine S-methyltransferase family protein [Deltaproteobacteria bacterium]